MSISQQDFDSIPDEALPVIQVERANGVPAHSEGTDQVTEARTLAKEAADVAARAGTAKEKAIQILLGRKNQIEKELAEFGYQPVPDWVGKTKTAVAERKEVAPAPVAHAPEATIEIKLCPLCKVPGHDLRAKAHRIQGKTKRPLTAKELAANREIGFLSALRRDPAVERS